LTIIINNLNNKILKMNKTLIKTSVVSLLLTSSSAIKFGIDDVDGVARSSLDAIMQQEADEKNTLYPEPEFKKTLPEKKDMDDSKRTKSLP